MRYLILLLGFLLLAACSASPEIFPTATPITPGVLNTQSPVQTPAAPAVTQTPEIVISESPNKGDPEVNPLTGLEVGSQQLNRRPLLIKVENLPRNNRPQWGLSAADLIYEYYTEEGTTRFAAIYYGEDASQVAPIRSARWFDIQLVQMYRSTFVFGSAYADLLEALFASNFKNRLVIEQPDSCPALCRYDPRGHNFLMANTGELQNYLLRMGFNNDRQELDGMVFNEEILPVEEAVSQVYVRFSGAIYNRWDYDPSTKRYLRFSDAKDDLNHRLEEYEPLLDRATEQQVGVENLVVILTEYAPITITDTSQVYDIPLKGSGWAFIFRDGKVISADWVRDEVDGVLKFRDQSGKPVELRPGKTWIEVLNRSSTWNKNGETWRFEFKLP